MKRELLKDLQNRIKNEKIELCGGFVLFEEQLEKILEGYENSDENEAKKLLLEQYRDVNKTNEPHRTQITAINLLMVEILHLYFERGLAELRTDEIHNIDTVEIEEIIREHIENLKSLKIKSSQFSTVSLDKKMKQVEDTFSNKDKKRDMIYKALKYLSAYNIIELKKIRNLTYNIYKLNIDSWFELQRYSLYKTPIIKDLLILLVAFIKYNAPNKVNHFLEIIDNTIEFFYTPPKNNEKYANVENYIIRAHTYSEPITFEVFDKETVEKFNNQTLFENVEIKQIKIDYGNEKILKFTHNDITYDLPIKKIYRVHTDENEHNSLWLKSENCYVIYNDLYKEQIKNKNYPKEIKKENIILRADTNMLIHFETKPLNDQVLYKTEEEKLKLIDTHNIDISANDSYIYITATDSEDRIFDIVKRNIPHIKILKPSTLEEKLFQILNRYTKCNGH